MGRSAIGKKKYSIDVIYLYTIIYISYKFYTFKTTVQLMYLSTALHNVSFIVIFTFTRK